MKKQLSAIVLIVALLATSVSTAAASTEVVYSEITEYASQDAFVHQGSRDANHGSEDRLEIRACYGGGTEDWELASLIRFDLSALPENVYIASADLYLYYYGHEDNDPAGRQLTVYSLNDAWDEDIITWDDRPRNAGKKTSTTKIPTKYGWMQWDVTADIQEYVEGTWENYGWQVVDENAWGQVNIPTALFYTREGGEDTRPYIVITYSNIKPNELPEAVIAGPYSGYVNMSILVDGSQSYDADGNITGYRWDYNNDSTWDTPWKETAMSTLVYERPGNYTLVLQVKDDDDDTACNTSWVNVTIPPNKKPEVNFTYIPVDPVIGEPMWFNDTSSDDGEMVAWWWRFGDGHYADVQQPVHTYIASGVYTVNLTVTDDNGENSSITQLVTVREYRCGDVTGDAKVSMTDCVALIKYLYADGESPMPMCRGDADGDGCVSVDDVIYLIKSIHVDGFDSPVISCCD